MSNPFHNPRPMSMSQSSKLPSTGLDGYGGSVRTSNIGKPFQESRLEYFIHTFPIEYWREDNIYVKKELIDKSLTDQTTLEIFQVVLQCILQEPQECVYRVDLFDYLIDLSGIKSPRAYKAFFQSESILRDFIITSPFLEYIDTILLQLVQGQSPLTKLLKPVLVQKLSGMTNETKIAKLYVGEVEKFIRFKEENPTLSFNILSEEKLFFLRKIIHKMVRYIKFIANELDTELLNFVLVRYLLIIHPQMAFEDYQIIADISILLDKLASKSINNPKTSDLLVKDLLVELISVLKINYLPEDNFLGFSNVVLALEHIEPKDLMICVEKYFVEIMQAIGEKKETLGKIFENLIAGNFTQNTCSLIRFLAENCRVNFLYDHLYYIFREIIIPHLVPKLRVDRAFPESLPLCEFFFYGFGRIPLEFTENLCGNLMDILQMRCNLYEKNSSNPTNPSKQRLREYLNFLEGLCYLYKEHGQNSTYCDILIQDLSKKRNGFYMNLTSMEVKDLIDRIEMRVWPISSDDLKNSISLLESTETTNPLFKPTTKYKGIRNIGNTCYLACVMQALFTTKEFREKIMSLVKETIQTSPLRKDKGGDLLKISDILRETQYLFTQLDTKESDAKCGDIQAFRESLPDQFRLANMEQDASEFLKIYLDSLENRLKPTSQKDLVDKCFAGQVETSLECSKCRTKKKNKEKFLDLVVNFEERRENEILDEIEMIGKAFETEIITEEVLCEKCKKSSPNSIKNIKILKLPSYLIITFNRFKFDQVGVKLNTPVKIYQQIDSRQFVQDKDLIHTVYNLYAVLVHTGPSTEHGHYHILVKDRGTLNGWFLINDSQCKYAENIMIGELFQHNKLETPYILFYEDVNKMEKK